MTGSGNGPPGGAIACPRLEEGIFFYDPERGWVRAVQPPMPGNTLLVFVNVLCKHTCNELFHQLSEKAGGLLGRAVDVYLVVCTRFHKVCGDPDAGNLFRAHDVIASPAVVLYIGGRLVAKLQGRLRLEQNLDSIVKAIAEAAGQSR